MINNNLVGGIPIPLKNDGLSSSVGMMILPKCFWKVIKFHGSKPPIRYVYIYIWVIYIWVIYIYMGYIYIWVIYIYMGYIICI